MMSAIITFGSWLKRARRQMDLTQKELAFQCGCSVGTIRKIEADERQPSRQLARLMAENLDIPPEKRDAFIAFARSEPYLDDLSFPTLKSATEISLAHAPAPAAEDEVPQHNLPLPTTPFFGRRRELAKITSQLSDPQCRLLTILDGC